MRSPEDAIKSYAQQCARQGLTLKQSQALFKSLCISNALARSNGNIAKAAELLGINRVVIHRHLKGYVYGEDA